MCGIAGSLDVRAAQNEESLTATVRAMAQTLHHRGPDGLGSWVDPSAGLALGHRRLCVIDPSEHGHQPMVSRSGRYVIVYNGEIYNFRSLRSELEGSGARFRGHSDTEVLLAGIDRWGLDRMLARCNGMFAFALWDNERRSLHLVRDRLGEKPLYYGWFGPTLLFGSELKALRAHPAFSASVDRGALALYLRHNCVPSPHSIYEGVHKLPPASRITFRALESSSGAATPVQYWSALTVVDSAANHRVTGEPEELADNLEALLVEAVGLRMESDVPLGAFLSGGIDSSLVVALMQRHSSQRVRTFTIGTDVAAYDESAEAAKVAAHLGTDHTQLRVSPADAMSAIPDLPAAYDEPFADPSQVPTLLLSRLTRRHVTVALSGDGGDELFAGYNRYAWAQGAGRRLRLAPRPARQAMASLLDAVPPASWDAVFRAIGRTVPRWSGVRNPADKLDKVAAVLAARSAQDSYRRLVSNWKDPAAVVIGAVEPASQLSPGASATGFGDVEQMMYLDLVTYLPDDILVKVDRAAMSVGLETRLPFLDHNLVEQAWRLPMDMKLRGGQGKWLLRKVLNRHVPPELVERPKAGFDLPLGEWLRGPLREWAETLLDPGRLRRDGYLEATPVAELWALHLAGRRDAGYRLWSVLMFQSWLEHQA